MGDRSSQSPPDERASIRAVRQFYRDRDCHIDVACICSGGGGEVVDELLRTPRYKKILNKENEESHCSSTVLIPNI